MSEKLSPRPLFGIKLHEDFNFESIDQGLVERLNALNSQGLKEIIQDDSFPSASLEKRVALAIFLERNRKFRQKYNEVFAPKGSEVPLLYPTEPVQKRLEVTLFGKKFTFHFTSISVNKVTVE